jgi:formylmethanofuran--tetrahydromethanopterin N-formyltransferase
MCETKRAVAEAGEKALKAIHQIEDVITPFDICSAGSKPETRFPWIGPTTNHPYVQPLKERLEKESRVPEGINYTPEIVINGTSIATVKEAIKVAIRSACAVNGVASISAGNYGGRLGSHNTHLRELFS